MIVICVPNQVIPRIESFVVKYNDEREKSVYDFQTSTQWGKTQLCLNSQSQRAKTSIYQCSICQVKPSRESKGSELSIFRIQTLETVKSPFRLGKWYVLFERLSNSKPDQEEETNSSLGFHTKTCNSFLVTVACCKSELSLWDVPDIS